MKFDNNIINEIRNNLDIVDVISNYIPLVSKGKNYFGVCPFHDDHSPSMSVSHEKQIYTCFSCGATGNVFNFVADYEKISFKEALKKCADMAGVDLNINVSHGDIKNKDLYDIYSLAQKFYQNNINSTFGKKALTYLNGRGISEDAIKHFNIGLSLNENNALLKILNNKKYSKDTLLKTGLITANNHDFFINRIMFPLCNPDGKVIGYNGRIYNNEDTNRYLNTLETELFKKREFLFNYHNAKEEVRRSKNVIVMEGPMDVIKSYTIGVKNVIATLGTAFTSEHALMIRRLKCDVILCFDGDDAGLKGTKLAVKELTNIGITPKIVLLPNKYDPDTLIAEDKDSFMNLINNPISVMDFKEKVLKNNLDLSNSVDLANYVNQMIEEIKEIKDPILKEITINKLCDTSKLDRQLIMEKINEGVKVPEENIVIKKEDNKKLNKYEKSERNLLYYMLRYKEVIKMYDNKITHISTAKYRHLAFQISSFYKQNKYINIADLITALEDDKEAIKTIGELETLNLNEKYTEEEIDDYLNNILEENLINQKNIYEKELMNANNLQKQIEYANKTIEYKLRSEENDR